MSAKPDTPFKPPRRRQKVGVGLKYAAIAVASPRERSSSRTDTGGAIPLTIPARSSAARESVFTGVGARYSRQLLATSLPLIAADLLSVSCAFAVAVVVLELLRSGSTLGADPLGLSLVAVLPVALGLAGLYPGSGIGTVLEIRQMTVTLTALFLPFLAAVLTLPKTRPLAPVLAIAFLATLLIAPLVRCVARITLSRFEWWGQPILLLGDREATAATRSFLRSRPDLGLRPVEVVADSVGTGAEGDGATGEPPWLETAIERAKERGICSVAVVASGRPTDRTHALLQRLSRDFPSVVVLPSGWGAEFPSLSVQPRDYAGQLGIEVHSGLLSPLPQALKRAVDLVAVLIGGIVGFPLIAVLGLLVRLTSPGPAVYSQERVGGKKGKFRVWKFRTMVHNADEVLREHLESNPALREEWEANHKLRNDPRVTTMGRFLRVTSLDELPQLWNVLRGEMSLVGPRPIVEAEIPRYGSGYDLYRRVPPGLTGLWQVSGRNLTTYQERVRLDCYYVRNWSPWLDIYIVFRTFKVVLFREGAF